MAAKFDFESLDKPFEADWPVVVSVPQANGKVVEQRFSARFRLLDGDLAETIAMLRTADGPAEDIYRKFFVGFGANEEQTLTDELLTKMLQRPYVSSALLAAYTKFATGIPEKN